MSSSTAFGLSFSLIFDFLRDRVRLLRALIAHGFLGSGGGLSTYQSSGMGAWTRVLELENVVEHESSESAREGANLTLPS